MGPPPINGLAMALYINGFHPPNFHDGSDIETTGDFGALAGART